MTRSDSFAADRSFPCVLVCSTFATIFSLAAVRISPAASLSLVVGA